MIHQLACNEQMQSFAFKLRGNQVDANLLLMPLYGFLPFDSIQMRQTYERIRNDLGAGKGLFYRNREQEEGAFLLCSFWAVEYLARGGGSLEEAKILFEDVLKHVNDVGILSEEVDPTTGDLLGNFPLTFSHLGLVNAILAIDQREKQEDQSSHKRGSYHELG
jgi:GH15 family glucan-1,4-alpha-glucosidase